MTTAAFGSGFAVLALAMSIGACSADNPAGGEGNCVRATDSELDALFESWNDALSTGDASKVAELYRSDAVLLPTLSVAIADTPGEITQYFANLIKADPKIRMEESVKFSDCNLAYNVGRWVINANGQDVAARVTWVYRHEDGKWLIANHHSSVNPQ
ncbi:MULTISPECIES: SgcJ/EcaC family oxidoreductase [Rhodococcus]|uniref:SgcJ/EcaC family oxidoreductase n=1 Tax=Rhodococcus oxybenzonivorans TaxID=1990687 RepID=A0AAE5A8R7_9NOCA|nr:MULTISPECIES: SgcJ/EcaC family oxidoreductase [Rhodococcus]MDV7242419.1 SgcJ/EcaC family oxidoreductase [Rhodococcus oxybenzonivorans]MDV7268280.1 SgcJ/EcaC family oxidoreductase [Rhodococcus oxybenzonivorans]MDV7277166.1 SgcJ/EcaC family oxidoreductase [Rhodococcus oxybenzonivorans]MDV7331908.1 SgcJ/EcaC family oxidoreductase [Rhodococcus oxybenzonivorans]MDV7344129.1 SgcJ/EcaC family oxidoreductase [Rhodococcus oxybenzonivorans]